MTKNVEIVAVTKPVFSQLSEEGTLKDLSISDFVAYVARVSNPTNQLNSSTSERLLKYLADHAHWSPFEMAHIVMEINTTRDIARQILRHRSFSFQEFSQRYADVGALDDNGAMFTAREARLQDQKNRQNSIELDNEDWHQNAINQWWLDSQDELAHSSMILYKKALDQGIAKEVARAILPEGLTKSRLYMAGSLRSWIHYCQLRMANGTQKEHMDIAKQCWEAILKEFPSLEGIIENNG